MRWGRGGGKSFAFRKEPFLEGSKFFLFREDLVQKGFSVRNSQEKAQKHVFPVHVYTTVENLIFANFI